MRLKDPPPGDLPRSSCARAVHTSFTPNTVAAPDNVRHRQLKEWVAAKISAHRDWFATPGNRLPPSFALRRDLLAFRFDGKLPLLRSRTSK
jgi:hypothetical protein